MPRLPRPEQTPAKVPNVPGLHEGRKEGELTNREASTLNSEQRSVRRLERRVKADGEVTTKEKVRIEKKQDHASRHIRRAKNNTIDNN